MTFTCVKVEFHTCESGLSQGGLFLISAYEYNRTQRQKKKLEEAEKMVLSKIKKEHLKSYDLLKLLAEKRSDDVKEEEVREKLRAEAEREREAAAAAAPARGFLGRFL